MKNEKLIIRKQFYLVNLFLYNIVILRDNINIEYFLI